MAHSRSFKLKDGRTLHFRDDESQDLPFILIHGTPGAGVIFTPLYNPAKSLGLRYIAVTRSGYGRSTRHPGRAVIDEARDIHELVDHLGLDKVLIAGWSGGCPVSLACATLIPQAIAVAAIAPSAPYPADGLDWLAGQGQDNIDEFNASMQGESASFDLLAPQRDGMITATPEELNEMWDSILPPVDKKTMAENAEFGRDVMNSIREGLGQNVDGWVDDNLSFVKPWGFNLTDINVPAAIWHGSLDAMCPFAHGEWLAKHIPAKYVSTHFFADEGHISIVAGKAHDILSELKKFA